MNTLTKQYIEECHDISTLIPLLKSDYSIVPAEINTNCSILKDAVIKVAESYKIIQYSSDSDTQLKQMKKDRASLRKLQEALNAERILIKKKASVPIEEMEKNFKELVDLIETPCLNIDKNIKLIEENYRKQKRNDIRTFYDKEAVIIPDDFKEQLYSLIYKSEWENSSTTIKKYKEGILEGIKKYNDGILAINSIDSDFKEEGLISFKKDLNLSDALSLMNRLKKQQEEAEQRAKIRLEQENQRKIKEAEERARREEQERAKAKIVAAEAEAKRKVEETKQKYEQQFSQTSFVKKEESKNQLYIRITNGMITGVYSNLNMDITILDEDIAFDNQEILKFEKAIKKLSNLI